MQEPINKQPAFFQLKVFNFLVYGTMVIFTSFFQLYLQDAGMDKLEIGSLMALGALVSLAANPFWMYWSYRLQNTKRILLFMMVGTLLLIQFVFQANTFKTIYLAMMLFFFFQSPMFLQSNNLVLGYISGTSRTFGSYRRWGSIGWAVTAIAAGIVIDQIGVSRLSYLFTGILILAIGTVLLLPPLRRPPETAHLRLVGFGKMVTNRYFVAFILLGILVSIPNVMNNTFMSLYITELGGSKTMVGLAVFLSSFLEVGVFMLFDRFLKRNLTSLIASLALVSLLFSLRWLLMADATHPLEVALIQILQSITFGGYFYVGTQVVRHLIPPAYQAPGQSVFTLTWGGISGVIGSIAGGWLFQNFGGEAMYRTGVMLALIGAAGFGFMWYWIRMQGITPPGNELQEDDPESGTYYS